MKTTTTLALLLLNVCLTAKGQLLLNAGDSYTLNFNNLDLVQANAPGVTIFSHAFPLIGGYSQLDVVRIRVWEDNMSQAPICDYNWGIGCSEPPLTWADHQGVVQVDVIQGSITLQGIRIHAEDHVGAAPNTHNVYETTFVAVPEPSVSLLLGAAMCLGGIWCWRVKRRS